MRLISSNALIFSLGFSSIRAISSLKTKLVGGTMITIPTKLEELLGDKSKTFLTDEFLAGRDPAIFQYVIDFTKYGNIPRNDRGLCMMDDEDLIKLKLEAKLLGLKTLESECNNLISGQESPLIMGYRSIYEFDWSSTKHFSDVFHSYLTNYSPQPKLNVLFNEFAARLCQKGKIPSKLYSLKLFANPESLSTVGNINIKELLSVAEQEQSESFFWERKSHEIPADKLNQETLGELISSVDLGNFAKNIPLDIIPFKLMIYQESNNKTYYRDNSEAQSRLGKLVMMLNTECEGGVLSLLNIKSKTYSVEERGLEIKLKTYSVEESGAWTAFFDDTYCRETISPITSGSRVLIFFNLIRPEFQEYYDESDEESNDNLMRNKSMRVISEDKSEEDCDSLDGLRDSIKREVEGRLNNGGSLCVTLFHRYPVYQSRFDLLKGMDYEIFEILKEFELKLVPVVLQYEYFYSVDILGSFYRHTVKEGFPKPELFVIGQTEEMRLKEVEQQERLDQQATPDIDVFLMSALLVTKKGENFLEELKERF